MSNKIKRLCKWKKNDLSENLDDFIGLVKDAGYLCKKCGRVSNNKKYLHKPLEMESKDI